MLLLQHVHIIIREVKGATLFELMAHSLVSCMLCAASVEDFFGATRVYGCQPRRLIWAFSPLADSVRFSY